jgi:ribosomal protein S18 acetylase RimI-like enzyme/cytochrome c oxidase assembly protein Cox11
MTEFKLVEYDPKYAKAIADMWNRSNSGWNGRNFSSSEESILQKEAASSHLNLYLALDEDKVVGYCKLSKYFAEEQTLYIDLLSVDPAYHGRKAGKLLVIKAVERTIELGYPRLDLFTWPGNTKAVPLYKKCGFFWEKMENGSTHLMNFIPAVLSNELLKDFFKDADWYNDSDRTIEIEPDGRAENGFDYLTYSWQKDGKGLLLEFEKSGRGICKIETNDYMISAKAPKNKLVFGQEYKISYEIVNKSNKPLNVDIKGKTDKNISCRADYTGAIEKDLTVEAEFFVDKIEIAQDEWKTHPSVVSEITVNGKNIIFKTGINPQFPIKLRANDNNALVHSGRKKEILFDVENNFDEDCTFTITFPEHDDIQFTESKKTIFLKRAERNTLAVDVIVTNSVRISRNIDIVARFSSGRTLPFSQKMRLTLNTHEGKLYSEDDYNHYMSYGKIAFSLDRHLEFNQMVLRSIVSEIWGFIGAPKIGKPFTSEFVRKPPYKTEFNETHDSMLLKCFYRSEDFPGCEFAQYFKLNRGGMLSHWYEIISFPDGVGELSINCEINFERNRCVMPYDRKLIRFDGVFHNDTSLDYISSTKLHENWIFCERNNGSFALIWPKENKISFCSWFLSVEHLFTRSGKLTTEPVLLAVDMFDSVKKLREFALGREVEEERILSSFDLVVNNNNPFTGSKVKGEFADFKEKPLEAEVKISSINDPCLKMEKKVLKEEDLHKAEFDFDFKGNDPIEIISARADYYSKEYNISKAAFIKTAGNISLTKDKQADLNVLNVDNGIISFKSSPEFAPSVFSLSYKGNEWLHTDFPAKTCKSWWNPWYGGITSKPDAVTEQNWINERTDADFVEKTDTFGNLWKGIQITTEIEKFDLFKGVTVRQYYLTMPNLPLMVIFIEVSNNSGFLKQFGYLPGDTFLNFDGDLKNLEAKTVEKDRVNIFRSGYGSIASEINANLFVNTNKTRSEKYHYYNATPKSKGYYHTDDLCLINCFIEHRKIKNGETKIFPPKFIIFSELELTEENLADLQNVRF